MTNLKKILLVDDSPINLQVLARYLEGMVETKLLFAANGERALQVAETSLPDLILLDIMLPGIDGYETCRRLKNIETLKKVPVLFLSALHGTEDKVKGFKAGGVDYISKPFQKEELIARLRTHLELYAIRIENERYAAEMETLAQQRAQALAHADRLATLGTLSAGVAHEINNPATFISVGIQTITRIWNYMESCMDVQAGAKFISDPKVISGRKNIPVLITNMKNGVSRIQRIVGALKTYGRSGNSSKVPNNINTSIVDALELCHNRLKNDVEITTTLDENLPLVLTDAQQIEQVFVNLFINAVDVLEKKPDGKISVTSQCRDSAVIVTIEDNGPGIPSDKIDKIWDPFFTTKPQDQGTGLGLSISKGIVEEHGGTIKALNKDGGGGGAVFVVSFPVKKEMGA